jgi:hypothetical protein
MFKRRFVSVAAALFAVGSLASISLAGCADTEGTFYVLNAITGTVEDDSCSFDPGASPLLNGSYELLGGDEYFLGLVVRSGLVSTEDVNKPQVETNHVEIYAVDVSLEGKGLLGTSACPSSFTYPSKGFVEPGEEGSTAALVIPSCARNELNAAMAVGESQTVIATFVVHGHTTGGDEVESPEYEFPISVYRGGYCSAPVEEEGGGAEENSGACGFGVNSPVPFEICDSNLNP